FYGCALAAPSVSWSAIRLTLLGPLALDAPVLGIAAGFDLERELRVAVVAPRHAFLRDLHHRRVRAVVLFDFPGHDGRRNLHALVPWNRLKLILSILDGSGRGGGLPVSRDVGNDSILHRVSVHGHRPANGRC